MNRTNTGKNNRKMMKQRRESKIDGYIEGLDSVCNKNV